MESVTLVMEQPNKKQAMFFEDSHKHVGFGGARGGGKSWAVRWKAILLALFYGGIQILIVRRTYPELMNNHIRPMRLLLYGIARYVDKEKCFYFDNGSRIQFDYCARDSDLDHFQGTEYDVEFFDEATQLSEYQIKTIIACLRGVNDFPKRIYYTMNPGGQSHHYFKRIFIDRNFQGSENPDEYSFIQSLVTDNVALMESDPEYVEQLKNLPEKLRRMWLEGDWSIAEGMFFEDFVIGDEEAQRTHQWTNVIEPFDIPDYWTIYRSFDWGYNKPFSVGWWAVSRDGVLYRILEWYGCMRNEANVGIQWNADKVFARIREIEQEHPWLVGKEIIGVADPAIWQKTTGISIEEIASQNGIYFTKADNNRIAGWQQMHYRFAFDQNGKCKMYIFNTCKDTIRTLPTLLYDEHKVEDLDTSMEDHIADEMRYMCNRVPIEPPVYIPQVDMRDDPLNMLADKYAKEHKGGIFTYA